MKKKLLTILLSAFMMLMVLPETVFAATKIGIDSIDVYIETGYGEKPDAGYIATTPDCNDDLKQVIFEYKDSGGATITTTTPLIEGDYTVNVTVEFKDGSEHKYLLTDANVTVNGSSDGITNLDKNIAGQITFTYSFHVDAPPVTIASILPNDFPTSESDAWVNEKGIKLYRGLLTATPNDIPTLELVGLGYIRADKVVTKSGLNYVASISDEDYTFVMNDGVLEKILISPSKYAVNYCGTYCAPLAISDMLPSYFPTSYDNGWVDQIGHASTNIGEGTYKIYASGGNLVLNKNGSEVKLSIPTNTKATIFDPQKSTYCAIDANGNKYKFYFSEGILSEIEISNSTGSIYGNYYIGLSDVLSKSKNTFPTEASNGWIGNNDKKIYADYSHNSLVIAGVGASPKTAKSEEKKGKSPDGEMKINVSRIILKNNGDYLFVDEDSGRSVLFEITNKYLVSIVISNCSNEVNGTYVAPTTIADILPDDFPTTSASGWINENGARSYKTVFQSKDRFAIYAQSNGEYGPFLTEQLTKVGNDYSVTDEYGATIKYVMDSGELKEIVVSGTGYDGTDYAGTYAPYKSYDVTDGKQASIDIKKGEDVLFTSKAEFSKFVGVKIDGNLLTETTDYTKAEGSTKITVKASYLNTLAAGSHTIEILSKDGSASTSFTIAKNQTPPPSSDPTPRYKVPNTGVEGTTNNHSLLKLSSLSLLAIGAYMVIKKKKDN